MSENATPYRAGLANASDPHTITEDLVALAHANRQGVPYETGEELLARLPERLRALADQVLGGKMNAGDVTYAVAALVDMIENAPAEAGRRGH